MDCGAGRRISRHAVFHRRAHARPDDPEVRARALDAFATSYWLPVSRYIQFKWRLDAERAADLTQEFFARTLEQGRRSPASIRRAPAFAPTSVCSSTASCRTHARPITA